MTIQITKIKAKDNKIFMAYEKLSNSNSWDEYTFNCSEPASPEFYKAIKALAADVIDLCELPDEYLDRIEVRGVSFSYSNGVMGATISASMELENSYCGLNLNTPYKASDSYCDAPADKKQLLSLKCMERLNDLLVESERYINGSRAQLSLSLVS